MKVLITGASGLLGRSVYAAFKKVPEKFEVTGTAFSRSTDELVALDLLDEKAVRSFLRKHQPDMVIHCAAERRPDRVAQNPQQSKELNIGSVKLLAAEAAASDTAFIFISTDYVFDGTRPPYTPGSRRNPLNLYGEMKRDGEDAVSEAGGRGTVLRVPILYGPCEPADNFGESAVTLLAGVLLQDGGGLFDNHAVRYPTWTPDIADFLVGLAEELSAGGRLPEILHFSGDEPYTKFEMAMKMADILNIDQTLLKPDNDPDLSVPRPRDAHLDCSGSFSGRSVKLTPFESGLKQILSV